MYRLGLFLLAGCVCLTAQESSPVPPPAAGPVTVVAAQMSGQVAVAGPVGGGNFAIRDVFPGPPVTGAPYSADTSTEMVQTLADGNRIDQTTTGMVARDSQGRTRVVHTLPGMPKASANGEPLQFITITDPVAGYTYILDPIRKIAHRMPVKMGPVMAQALQSKLQTKLERAASADGETFTKTDLGTQTIAGVSAQGTRITRTIPAGAIGNENPITSTTETWYSPDLKVMVMSKNDDPRFGETTYELTNIVQGEPSPDLFQVPSDYTVQDGPAKEVISLKRAQ